MEERDGILPWGQKVTKDEYIAFLQAKLEIFGKEINESATEVYHAKEEIKRLLREQDQLSRLLSEATGAQITKAADQRVRPGRYDVKRGAHVLARSISLPDAYRIVQHAGQPQPQPPIATKGESRRARSGS